MIIVIELLLITVLAMIMLTIVIDETNHRKRARHLVRLKEYWDGKERRVVERCDVILDVNYSINHNFKNSKSKNISTRGLGLILEEKLERRTPLTIEVKIDSMKEFIKAKASVMWSKEAVDEEKYSPKRLFETGIKFTRFADAAHEKRLFDYIRSIEKNSPHEYADP
ncbi:MAG: PilZ domain-containing protein [Candidatus Omnitrophica bacterium]|nr:PilZ domain-containing protein [Candidatus Omnitrophota bacterium]